MTNKAGRCIQDHRSTASWIAYGNDAYIPHVLKYHLHITLSTQIIELNRKQLTVPLCMAKPPKLIPHKDHYARISFLYQSSALLAARSGPQNALSRALARNVDLVSKKTVLKLTPLMKRTICKKCHLYLIPGLTMTMHIENLSKAKQPHNDVLVHTCSHCHTHRRFPVGKDRDYILFSERDDVAIPVG